METVYEDSPAGGMDNRPIGVFDSGLGGLTVVRQLLRQLPGEDICYFGDTGRVPYGSRSKEIIAKYARQDCRFLMGMDVKMIIAACGTVSSTAPHVLAELPLPAIGVVESAADAAARATRNGRIGVIGTAATIRSDAFRRRLELDDPALRVFQRACPLFVPLVENGWIDRDDPVTRLAARRYLEPLAEQQIDTLILGCTHFPLLTDILSDIMGEGVTLIDAGREAAVACAGRLEESGALNRTKRRGFCRFYVSDRPEDFSRMAAMFLGREMDGEVETVQIETLDGGNES